MPLIAESLVAERLKALGIEDMSRATIREIVRLANELEAASEVPFVHMEMGVPGLRPSSIGTEAEIAALKAGVAQSYPPVEGIPELKAQVSLFVKNFVGVEVDPEGCVPTVGSMQGGMAAFLLVNRCMRGRDRVLFIDPGFPVQKQQLRLLGMEYDTFDVYDYRGAKLKGKLEEFLARYTDLWVMMISGSKAFSYAGQRIGTLVVSDALAKRKFENCKSYFPSEVFGKALVYGAMYGLSSGVAASVQHGFAAMLRAANEGRFNFVEAVREYGRRAQVMKRLFTENGFRVVYDMDGEMPLADGFYFTVSYPGMEGGELLRALLPWGITAISLGSTGSRRTEGLRACVSHVMPEQFDELERRLKGFHAMHSASK